MSAWALVWKDLHRELRSKEAMQAGIVLVLLFLILDTLSFSSLADQPRTAAAILWIPLLYASAAVVGRGFSGEADRGTLDLLRSAPVSLAAHGWSRTLVHLAALLVLALATLACAAALFALPVAGVALLAIALGATGFAVVATLASALAAQARSRDVLLPILLVPVTIPLLQAGLAATTAALRGDPDAASTSALLMMAGYDLVAAGVAWFLWPIVLEGD